MAGTEDRKLHVVAAGRGVETAAELAPAFAAGGSPLTEHLLPPVPQDAWDDPARLRAELGLVKGALAAAERDGGTLLLADERGAIAIPERMRTLLDEAHLGWDEAWARMSEGL